MMVVLPFLHLEALSTLVSLLAGTLVMAPIMMMGFAWASLGQWLRRQSNVDRGIPIYQLNRDNVQFRVKSRQGGCPLLKKESNLVFKRSGRGKI